MAFDWSKPITSIARGIGSFINDVSGTTAQQAFNSAEAQKQRDYETTMSNSAYTRAVADMKNAGLNPALMYANGGSGASTPAVSSASSNIHGSNPISSIVGIIGSAAQLRSSTASLINAGENANLNKAKMEELLSSAALNKAKLAQIASSAAKVIKGFI